MNIAGYNLEMPQVDWLGTIQKVSMWGVIGLAVIGIGIWLFMAAKDKKIYKYPVTLRVRREGGIKVRHDLWGGLVVGRNGIKDFKFKIPGSFKKLSLGYIPDFSLAGSDDRLGFIQEGDATLFQQTREELITEKYMEVDGIDGKKEIAVYKLLVEPIPTDIKTSTYNNLQTTKELMDIKKLTAFGITIVGFIIMVIAHLISLYVQTKIKCNIP